MKSSVKLRPAATIGLVVVLAAGAWMALGPGEPPCAPGGDELSVYEWRTSAWDTPAAASDLLTTAEALCLTYVHVDVTGLAVDDKHDDVERALTYLLELSKDSPVEIGALAGDPWWASPEGLEDATEVLERIDRINQSSGADITSIHLDVEPWGLDEWAVGKSQLATSFVSFVADIVAARDEIASTSFQLSVLIPYWFDGSIGEAPLIEISGSSNYPLQHLAAADHEDVTWIVMAYRDRVQGDGGVLDLLADELSLADNVGLAIETAPVEPLSITFADESLGALDRELTTLLSEDIGLTHIVVNDFEHLRALAERESEEDATPSG